MNVLVDVGHPAHVHLFKNLIRHLNSRGHFVLITAREKDTVIDLLEYFNFPYQVLSSAKSNPIGMMSELLIRDRKILSLHKQYKFDLALGTSVSIAHLTLLQGVPSYNFNEDDDAYIPLYTYITYPFVTKIINPDTIKFKKWISKRVLYPSVQELAYLHPNNFKNDLDILKKYDLSPKQYLLVRLSALQAHHDLRATGISRTLEQSIEGFAKDLKIIYSREISKSNQIDAWDMHHILANAKMLISDTQTMTVEAAVLGVPSVRYSSFVGRSSVIEELERDYQLTFGFVPGNELGFLEKIKELLADKDLSSEWENKRERLLLDKVDFNQWMIEFFSENYGI